LAMNHSIYPAICRAVRSPPQNSAEAKKFSGGRAVPPLNKVSLYFITSIRNK